MKTIPKPERRRKKPAARVREAALAPAASRSLSVIAMAASAGGLKALSVILSGLPEDFPAAITIVMHLTGAIGTGGQGAVERDVYAASPSFRPKPSDLEEPTGGRGLKRAKGRAPARNVQSHSVVTAHYPAGTKDAMIQRRK
jgi:hypothetical protein